MMSGTFRFFLGCVTVLCLACLLGCDGRTRQRMALEGTVTFDKKPLAEGNIRLLSAAGADAMIVGGAITAGRFEIPANEGAWPGKYRVEIRAFRETGKRAQERSMREVDESVQFLPDRYNSQSKLTAEVTASGPNHFDFTLTP
jgi:hypothetical protein